MSPRKPTEDERKLSIATNRKLEDERKLSIATK